MEFIVNLKNRFAREIDEMSTFKRIAFPVGIVLAVVVAVLLLGGVWEPFAVQTGVTKVTK